MYVMIHTCVACPDGKFNKAGNDASLQNTSCVVLNSSNASTLSPSSEDIKNSLILQSGGVKCTTDKTVALLHNA